MNKKTGEYESHKQESTEMERLKEYLSKDLKYIGKPMFKLSDLIKESMEETK